ncbi:MAG: hypothetical protein KJP00_10260 [Bacteroidia bacterium]|nr:hypothetical protein [Bacteroidia bacterium]
MKKILFIVLAFVCVHSVTGQEMITTNDHLVDFTGFTGMGFTPIPGPGQLDSDTWQISGLSDGDLNFGGTITTGDYARGIYAPPESTGGIYGDDALWIQPGGSDLTPGQLTLKFQNNTGMEMANLMFSYEILSYNDKDRSQSINVKFNEILMPLSPSVDIGGTSTPGIASAMPIIQSLYNPTIDLNTAIGTALTIPPDGMFFITFETDDATGSGFRDEIGFDNIRVQSTLVALPPPVALIPTMGQWALMIMGLLMTNLSLVFMYNHKKQFA